MAEAYGPQQREEARVGAGLGWKGAVLSKVLARDDVILVPPGCNSVRGRGVKAACQRA